MNMTEIRRRYSDGHQSNQFASPISHILSFNTRGSGESSRKEVSQRWNFLGLLLTLKSTARMASSCCHTPSTASPPNNTIKSFWLLGVLNNSLWVLMLAVATDISSGGVALVFISNIIPGLLVKLSAPYWFHLISYKLRISMASIASGLACLLVGLGGLCRDEKNSSADDADQRWGLALQLLGVSLISFSCSLGEASILALAGKFDGILLPAITTTHSYRAISEEHAVVDDATHFSPPCFAEQGRIGNILMDETESEANSAKLMKTENYKQHRACITAFASGTGLAGIVGYGYKALISDLLGWSLSACVWSAVVFPLAYYFIYRNGVHNIELSMLQIITPSDVGHSRSLFDGLSRDRNISNGNQVNTVLEMVESELMYPEQRQQVQTNCSVTPHNLTSYERFKMVLSLWKYTIPLFTVYSAEYMLQAGVWPSIGFPVTSAIARAQFYQYSNWTYQAGVFISRSSGNLCIASIQVLWLMPFLQVLNLYFFWVNSLRHFWYNYSLLVPCFCAGLLGGGVYVQAFARVNTDMPVELKEFAVASIGVADSLGILVADILSLFIQSCIYKKNNIEGAVADCPFNM